MSFLSFASHWPTYLGMVAGGIVAAILGLAVTYIRRREGAGILLSLLGALVAWAGGWLSIASLVIYGIVWVTELAKS
jgi:hypothetical protein